jgi:hypothetical protein
MKKNNILIPILILFVTGSLLFLNSCKKDKFTNIENETSQINDKELSSQIVSFRNDMVNTHKTGTNETMNFGDAIWMMEAAFNFYHGFSDGDYLSTTTDSVYVEVDYNNLDEVAISDLQDIFISVNNEMLSKFESINLNNKRILLFDLELEATTSGNQLLCMMTIGVLNTQKAGSPSGSSIAPFDSDDYWFPGYITDNPDDATGKCGNYVGQLGRSDATFEQEKAARMYRRGTMSHRYFVDIETIDIYDNDSLFEGPDNECISTNTMNKHYDVIGNKIEYWYNYFNISSAKQFAYINIKNDFIVGKGGYYLRTYVDWIKYGQKKVRYIEEAPAALYSLP